MARFASASWLPPLSIGVVALLLLSPFIGVDPARGVTISNAPFSDEAWNLVGARNIALFGHPSSGEWRTWILTLPFTALQAAAFELLGVSLEVARLLIILVVAATGALITSALRPIAGGGAAWFGGLAYVTSALVLYYGRLAFLEPLVGAFLAVGILSLVPAARGRPATWGIVGGAALALAVMTKALAIGSALGVTIVVLAASARLPWTRRWLLGAVPTGAALGAAWLVLVIWPRRDVVAEVIGTIYPPYEFPADPATLLQNLSALPFTDGALFLALPILAMAVLGAIRVGRSVSRTGMTDRTLPAVAAAAALVSGLLLLGIVDYQPNRYVAAFLSSAAILGTWAVPRAFGGAGWRPAAVALVATVLLAGPGVVMHAGWIRDGGSEVARIQAAVQDSLPPGTTVAGQYAPLVAMRTTARTMVPFGTVDDGDLYAAGLRHLVWNDRGPPWVARHPEAWAARTALACMTWSKVPARICLYELPDEAD